MGSDGQVPTLVDGKAKTPKFLRDIFLQVTDHRSSASKFYMKGQVVNPKQIFQKPVFCVAKVGSSVVLYRKETEFPDLPPLRVSSSAVRPPQLTKDSNLRVDQMCGLWQGFRLPPEDVQLLVPRSGSPIQSVLNYLPNDIDFDVPNNGHDELHTVLFLKLAMFADANNLEYEEFLELWIHAAIFLGTVEIPHLEFIVSTKDGEAVIMSLRVFLSRAFGDAEGVMSRTYHEIAVCLLSVPAIIYLHDRPTYIHPFLELGYSRCPIRESSFLIAGFDFFNPTAVKKDIQFDKVAYADSVGAFLRSGKVLIYNGICAGLNYEVLPCLTYKNKCRACLCGVSYPQGQPCATLSKFVEKQGTVHDFTYSYRKNWGVGFAYQTPPFYLHDPL